MPEPKPLSAASALADLESSLRPVASQLAEFDRLNAVYGNSALKDIQRQMQSTSAAQAALDALSSSIPPGLATSSAHEELLRAVNPPVSELDHVNAILGNNAAEELLRQMQPTSAGQAALDAMSSSRAYDEILRTVSPADSELERLTAAYGSGSAFDDIQRHMRSMSDTQAILDGLTRPAPPAELFHPLPDFSNTPMHQTAAAAQETAAHVEKLSALTTKMVSDVSSLTKSIVSEALPAWMAQQKLSQEAANLSMQQAQEASNRSLQQSQDAAAKSSKQARTGLFLTALALFASALVAWWQVDVTKTLAAETAAQQALADKEQTARHEATQKALQDQLSVQRELIEQQRRDSEALRAALTELKPPPAPAKGR